MSNAAAHLPLIPTLFPTTDTRWLRDVLLMLMGAAVLALSAKMQIPFYPVPFTMQTAVVLLIGMGFGYRLAAMTVGFYLLQGALGLPVFANGGGLAYFASPTAGYLWGFLAAAALMGYLAERGWDRHWGLSLAAMALGHGIILLFGVLWLSQLIGVSAAIANGLAPFWASTILKILLAAVLLPTVWRVLRRR